MSLVVCSWCDHPAPPEATLAGVAQAAQPIDELLNRTANALDGLHTQLS